MANRMVADVKDVLEKKKVGLYVKSDMPNSAVPLEIALFDGTNIYRMEKIKIGNVPSGDWTVEKDNISVLLNGDSDVEKTITALALKYGVGKIDIKELSYALSVMHSYANSVFESGLYQEPF